MLDKVFKDLGFAPALVIVIVLAIALQLSGVWATMLIAGAFGGFFTRRYLRAFLVGFLGVGIAWSVMFTYLVVTTPAIAIASFFVGLLGLSKDFGVAVIVIAIVVGTLLGGFGCVLGRAVVELVEPLGAKKTHPGESVDARPENSPNSDSE